MTTRVHKRELAPGAVARSGLGEIQRARILVAMSEVVVQRGAGTVTVADVVGRSGVSRRTFYELFADREACFLAAFDRALALAEERVLPPYRVAGRWQERVRAGLQALLAFLDAEPDLGQLCLVASQAAGPRALERRNATIARLVVAIHEGARESPRARRPDRLTAEGLAGAVLAILASRIERRPLLPLLNRLMALIVLPYLGAAAAERELRRPKQRPRNDATLRNPAHIDALRDLEMRLTYRTVRVLRSIAELSARGAGPSNRQVAAAAGISDPAQISKLLARLRTFGLIENTGGDRAKGEPNAWRLTERGKSVTATLQEAA
ncbi:MAG TPA: TetR family transcriptional regulator [Solirubrobacteraceae bacterium]|nr:TetR family transcriptional regulator [Solirubrobacteraceae bacterium]